MSKKAYKFIENYTKHCSNECEGYCHEWVTPNVARGAVMIAREELINRACEWLKENLTNNPSGKLCASHYGTITKGELINEFRKAMEK